MQLGFTWIYMDTTVIIRGDPHAWVLKRVMPEDADKPNTNPPHFGFALVFGTQLDFKFVLKIFENFKRRQAAERRAQGRLPMYHQPSTQLNSTQLNSTQLNSTQLNYHTYMLHCKLSTTGK